ncbi:MAG: hypothetical protein HPY83_18370 [Anaerolineae bacterium]|nr:hypothetical protein [Anaerolineae bacterium]
MPLVDWQGPGLALVNAIVWVVIHLSVGYLAARVDEARFDPGHWLFRSRAWERDGVLYQRLLRVRRWKGLLPSGGTVFGAFTIHRLRSHDRAYLSRWLAESCRAEMTHWVAILPVVLFLLWNPPLAWAMNMVYAIVANVPCIIAQRYNRPRVLHLLRKQERRATMPSLWPDLGADRLPPTTPGRLGRLRSP